MIGFINGKIIGEDKVLEGSVLLVEDGRIVEIAPERGNLAGTELIDVSGAYIAPGFIDIHSDYCEQLIQPRATAIMDLDMAFAQVERILAAQGVTTVFHSLSLQNPTLQKVKEVRNLEFVAKIAEKIHKEQKDAGLIRHRLHLRIELDNPACCDTVAEWIDKGYIHEISFMDHTPGQGQYRNLEIYKKSTMAYMDMESDAVYDAWMEKQAAKPMISAKQMETLIIKAQELGIAAASHDDDTTEKIDFLKSMRVTISEFPITPEVAKRAAENGIYTVFGAPNVLLGGSHSGNLSAAEVVTQMVGGILCSDYYPAGLLYSVFILNRTHHMPLPACFALTSLNPAKALRIEKDYGSLAAGKKADFLIIKDGEPPCITEVYTDGRAVLRYRNR
ncbi:MAG: alpha-D-ribose 1-methylphosphonate 5-triphosphate diphosphatase [Clostridiales Family XIII bacterium]|jgi:alpha-D-ribose 1-methylphosphonate 5-triphosphate diphosphatase|nr:alpha-D-ribose 1-methylphosphonate 5-triphosphate diphosphatase [Clostridiales Family XIII bacterium]